MIALGRIVRRWVASVDPWTNVYGVARTVLALGTAATLACNHASILFRPASGLPSAPFCGGMRQVSLFCRFPAEQLELARWVAVALLLIVASGWRPRLTGVPHWWVSFSLQASAMTLDGGDQVTAVLTLLLLPVTLTDRRRWHWQRAAKRPPRGREELLRFLALSALLVVRLQVAGIYLHASVAKMGVPEWADGTALYYWLTRPSFGAPDWLMPVLMPLLTSPVTVVLLTWGVILVEFVLFLGLILPKRTWGVLLVLGLALHAGIALIQGLVSFSLAMAAALVLYLRPIEKEFTLGLPQTAPLVKAAKLLRRVQRINTSLAKD